MIRMIVEQSLAGIYLSILLEFILNSKKDLIYINYNSLLCKQSLFNFRTAKKFNKDYKGNPNDYITLQYQFSFIRRN